MEITKDIKGGRLLSFYEGRISIKEFLALVAAYFSSLSMAPQEFLGEAEKALRGKLARAHKLEEAHGAISDKDKASAMETVLKTAYYLHPQIAKFAHWKP